MNGVSFSLKKYMNGSCFSLSLVYEWGGVRWLQPHIRTQNHGKLPPTPVVVNLTEQGINILGLRAAFPFPETPYKNFAKSICRVDVMEIISERKQIWNISKPLT